MSRKENNKWFNLFYEIIAFAGGSCLFGIGMTMFLTPGQVVMGGLTGIGSTINFMTRNLFGGNGFPIGIAIIIMNTPLILINMKVAGYKAMIRTILGIIGSSLMMDVFTAIPADILPRVTDQLQSALVGGACMGAASGIYLTRGFTNGGTDLASYMLKRKFKRMSTGRFIFVLDIAIIIGSGIVTGRYTGIIYSAISVFAYSVAVDMVLGGADRAKMMLIVSSKYQLIADEIIRLLPRGVTVLYGRGWYTKEDKCVLMCVVKRSEEFQMRAIIKSVDPQAFLILSEATEVLGYGFKVNE